MCQILGQYHTILNTAVLQYSLDLRRLIPPVLFLFLNIAWGIQGLLWFDINFRIVCFSSVKNVMGILIGIALNLRIALANKNVLEELNNITETMADEVGLTFRVFIKGGTSKSILKTELSWKEIQDLKSDVSEW